VDKEDYNQEFQKTFPITENYQTLKLEDFEKQLKILLQNDES